MQTKQTETAQKKDICVYDTPHGQLKLSPDTVRKYLVSGGGNVTEQDIMMFMCLCKYQKLNPFLKEAYLIKYGNEATIIVGKDVFTKRASKNPNCNGWKAGIIVQKDDEIIKRESTLRLTNETLVGGWATVWRKDWKEPLMIEVSLNEYIGLKRDGTANSNWAKRPATMIRKVAIVQALRDAFPEDLQGMYAAEEMEGNQVAKTINADTTDTSNVDDFLEQKEPESIKTESKPEEIDNFKEELDDA